MRVVVTVVLFLLLCCGVVCGVQVLRNPSFEDEITTTTDNNNVTSWQPFLSGFYVVEHSARTGERQLSLTPHHFLGVWQSVHFDAKSDEHPTKSDGQQDVVLVMSAHCDCEFGFDSSVSIGLFVTDESGRTWSVSRDFEMGVMGYQRQCAAYKSWPVASVTAFLTAHPLTQNFGTIFCDDFDVQIMTLDEAKSLDAACGPIVSADDVMKKQAASHAAADRLRNASPVKSGVVPTKWSHKSVAKDLPAICAAVVGGTSDVDYFRRLSVAWKAPAVAVILLDEEEEKLFMEGGEGEKKGEEQQNAAGGDVGKRVAALKELFQAQHDWLQVVVMTPSEVMTASSVKEALRHRNTFIAMAERMCLTERVLHLEAGEMPSSTFLSHVPALNDGIVIIPAFEVATGDPVATQVTDRAALRGLAGVRPAQTGHHVLSAFSTNYTRWQTAEEPYTIEPVVRGLAAAQLGLRGDAEMMTDDPIFNRHYHPTFVVPKALQAEWDTRFVHRGHARASYLAELVMRRAKFVVASHAFVTRSQPPAAAAAAAASPSLSVNPTAGSLASASDAVESWKAYYSFLADAARRHNWSDQRLFRAMPIDSPKDHRLEMSLWKRVFVAILLVGSAIVLLVQLLRLERPPGGSTYAYNPLLLQSRGQVKEL